MPAGLLVDAVSGCGELGDGTTWPNATLCKKTISKNPYRNIISSQIGEGTNLTTEWEPFIMSDCHESTNGRIDPLNSRLEKVITNKSQGNGPEENRQ